MSRSLSLVCLVSIGLIALAGCAPQHAHFGTPMKHEAEKPLTVTEVVTNLDKYDGQYVRITGEVLAVGEGSDCWMHIVDEDESKMLRCEFTYDLETGRVPPEAKGKTAIVEGKLTTQTFTEEQRRAMGRAKGQSEGELAKVVGPITWPRLDCCSASIKGVKPAQPRPREYEHAEHK